MKSIALIPAFNEEETIQEVISRLKSININSIVIDDGSTDRTSEIAEKNGAILLKNEKNKGKGDALKIGFRYVFENLPDVENIVLIDADLQYDPKDAIKFLDVLENKEADFVMGYRDWKKIPFRHRLGNFIWRKFFNILFGTNLKDTNCGFVGLSRNALKKMSGVYGGYVIENMMLTEIIKNNLKIKQVPVKVKYKLKRNIVSGIRIVLGCLIFIVIEGVKYRFNKI